MEIDGALNFFGCSVFIALGIIAVGIAVLVVNNLFMKYWKPIPLWTFTQYKFVEHDATANTTIDKTQEPRL